LIANAIERCVLPVPEEADVAVLGDPRELREVQDQRLLGARLRGEIEVLQRLVRRERGVANTLAGAGGVAREDLGLQERLEELLVGHCSSRAHAAVCSRRSSTRGAFIF
jgi:hypothetical protein